uniref:Uncharacterized protein n=1 Tax=Panagrolaimus superbus TaxID=310955 RepID=A0A914ZBM0_9BILA
MYSVMSHQQQYPQNYFWESSTSSCSEEDENDSDISFDMKSDNDGFELFDEMIKTESFEHQQNLHLQAPHLQQQDQSSLASVPPHALCSDTAANLSSPFKTEKQLPTRMISPSMIKSEMSPCFDENQGIPSVQMHQQLPMHPLPEPHQQQHQQIMSTYGTSVNNTQSANNEQIDIYRDLILRHLIQDIGTTCSKLYLPTNPLYWNVEHANRWIVEMCHQFQLPLPSHPLNLTGQALLEMTQAQLCQKMPDGGDTLHAQLHLWKTASENNQGHETSNIEIQNCGGGIVHHRSSDSTSSSNGWMSPSTPTKNGMGQQYGMMNYSNGYEQQRNQEMNMYYGMQQQQHNYQQSLPQMIPQQHHQDQQRTGSKQFFMYNQQILPSPSDSEISSNASSCLQDVTDDDCSDIHYINMPSNYVPPPQALGQPMNSPANVYNMPMHNVAAMSIPQLGMATPAIAPQSAAPVAAYSRNTGTVHLWHFIRELLDQPKQYGSCVRWVDREEGTFKIESSHHLARYWGQRKNRSQMNYDKLSRSLRQYYKKGIIQKPEKKQRLVYKFLPPYNL